MLKIGLTGGIGSGKTRVADLFHEWGAGIIDTDVIAHTLTQSGGQAMPAIVQAFGSDVVAADGAMDRAAMRERVFRDSQARQTLESIVHPLIAEVTQQQAEQTQGCYLVYVVPLLVESGRWLNRVDRVCVVDCDPATQIRRVQARNGLTIDAIERIMSTQVSRAARLAVARDVVLNDGATTPDKLRKRARKVHDYWLSLV